MKQMQIMRRNGWNSYATRGGCLYLMRYEAVSERIRTDGGRMRRPCSAILAAKLGVWREIFCGALCLPAVAFNDEVSILFDLSRQLLECLSRSFINGFLV